MKKFLALALCALMMLSVLTACGGSAKVSNGSKSFAAGDSSAPMDMAPAAAEDSVSMEYGFADSASTGGAEAALRDAKMIYTANLEMETTAFDEAVEGLGRLTKEMGGYYEDSSLRTGGSGYRWADYTIRVPAEQFEVLLDRAGQAAHMVRREAYSEDVSEAYYDSEARLTTQRTKLERLQELLGKAESMEDIITLESAISDTELQIEYLTGSLRKYDSQISYSTVRLCLSEVYRLSTDEEVPVTFAQRLSAAFAAGFHRGVEGLEDFIIGLAQIWVLLVILAVGALIVVLVLRSCRKRKPLARGPEAGRMPAPPAPEAKKAEKED